jgi:folate-binding protein YgfZ
MIMTPSLHQINSRQLTTFSPLTTELVYAPNTNYLFDLSYLAVLQVIGDKAQEFLQGQLSCDLRDVTPQQMRQGALCNLKGRVLALADVINWFLHGLHLIVPADLLIETQTSLAKTAMFSRVTLHPATDYQLFGFYLQNINDVIPFDGELPKMPYEVVYQDGYCCYCFEKDFYIFLVNAHQAQALREKFIKISQWRGSLAWHALQLQRKRIEIYPQSRGMFLPHRIGLQLSNYLSFNKGCYKGQEIIARTHYRAKLKHELKLFTIETDETLQPGQKLFSNDNSTDIGELLDYCPIGEKTFLIIASVLFEHPAQVHFEGHKHPISL